MDRVRASARRELVFLALGAMDVCVIAPLFAGLFLPTLSFSPLSFIVGLLGAVLAVHYLARLFLRFSIRPALRIGAVVLGMLVSGLLVVHQMLYAQTPLVSVAWLAAIVGGVRREILSRDVTFFLSALFLWWRGIVLAQRRLDSESVAFRFRLGVLLLAVTTGVGGALLSWPYHHVVFFYFFASMLGIALARAEEVGQRYGGGQSPFGIGWLATLVSASLVVLLLAVGLTSLLTDGNLAQLLGPVLDVLVFLLFIVLYVVAWAAQLVIMPLLDLLQWADIGSVLEKIMRRMAPSEFSEMRRQPREPRFTAEQLELMRTAGAVIGVSIALLLVAISLHRLRMGAVRRRDEERESVWQEADLRRGLRDLLQRGRHRLRTVVDALGHSRVRQLFAALTIRRIYAHMGALAAREGYPRAIDETPYDYLPTLDGAFPDSHEDVMQITKAYVAVHYGELPERAEDLAEVRAAWERIQEKASARG